MSHAFLNRRDLLTLALATAGGSAFAQARSGAVSIIVPQPAGNPTDGVSRKVQPLLQKVLGQTVIVENLPGAGGSIGIARAMSASGDGQTLVITSQTEPILTPASLSSARYKPEDLRCVALGGRTPYVLAARPDLPANTLAELVALARKPGAKPFSHGHIGYGSMIHLLGEQFARKMKVELTQVPYKGVPPVVQDLMGGQIDLSFLPLGGNTPSLIETGKVKVYATTWEAPTPRLPKVPAMSKLDPALAGFVYGTWVALFVPRKTSDAAVQRLHKGLNEALQNPEVREYIDGSGIEPTPAMTLARLDEFYRAETKLYQGLVREMGITPQ